MLSSKERITRQARGLEVDRVPSIGGWMHGVENLAQIAGLSVEQYMANPLAGVVAANRALHVDAVVPPIVPQTLDQIRAGHVEESSYTGMEPEALKERADATPDTEKEVLAAFDLAAAEAKYRNWIEPLMKQLGDIALMPTIWEMGGRFPLYMEFGYEAFLSACALYPAEVGKIWWADAVCCRRRAEILVKLYREYDWVPLCFSGQDVCNNKGPMVSPQFLREHYWPHVKYITEPLVEAGIRVIHHCDGDVRPVVGDMLSAGFSGFQGFQYEVGVDPRELRKLRGPRGEEMLFFAGMSVTRTLPYGTAQDVRDEVDYFLDVTDGGRGLFLFTSNVTGVEVPPANLVEAYGYVKQWDPAAKRVAKHSQWPWLINHPEER